MVSSSLDHNQKQQQRKQQNGEDYFHEMDQSEMVSNKPPKRHSIGSETATVEVVISSGTSSSNGNTKQPSESNSDSASDEMYQLEHGTVAPLSPLVDLSEKTALFDGALESDDIQSVHHNLMEIIRSDGSGEKESSVLEASAAAQDNSSGSSPLKESVLVDESLRNAAFHQFKKIEAHYQNLAETVMREKEKELDRAEEAVNNGTHPALIKDMADLDTAYNRARLVAENNLRQELDKIATEYASLVYFANTDFVYKKSRLRRRILHNLKWLEKQVAKENEINHKNKLAEMIRKNDQKAVSRLGKSFLMRSEPYPIVEQFKWRCRENEGALASYQARIDDFGSYIPPDFEPMGLHPRDIDMDLQLIQQSKNMLEAMDSSK